MLVLTPIVRSALSNVNQFRYLRKPVEDAKGTTLDDYLLSVCVVDYQARRRPRNETALFLEWGEKNVLSTCVRDCCGRAGHLRMHRAHVSGQGGMQSYKTRRCLPSSLRPTHG